MSTKFQKNTYDFISEEVILLRRFDGKSAWRTVPIELNKVPIPGPHEDRRPLSRFWLLNGADEALKHENAPTFPEHEGWKLCQE